MALAQITVVAGPHALGVTVQLTDDVTVYVGMPAINVGSVGAEIERTAHRQAARLLRIAAEELETS